MKAPPLDFLVIGAQKCATSWLYYCLRDHPQIRVPAKKRELEYLGGDLYEERGPDWYFGLVGPRQKGKRLGDVSVEYLFDPRAPAVVKQYLPAIRLVALLRHPVERTISAYYWYLRKELLPVLPLAEGLAAAARAFRQGDRGSRSYELIERGCYAAQLARYLSLFHPDQLLAVTYDEVACDGGAVIRDVYDFIGVASAFAPPSLADRPKQNTYVKPLIGLERALPTSRLVSKAADQIGQWLSGCGLGRRRPELPADVEADLAAVFADDLLRTRELLADRAPEQRLRILDGWTAGLT